jgi:poly(A) polymerase Pap1
MRTFTKTVTPKQLAANRANGQKSSGPHTEAGKAVSSQNRRWHGLAGRFKVLQYESQEAFEKLFDEFVRSEQPVGAVELELVRKMAEYTWLRERATRFHESCFYVEDQNPEDKADNKAVIRVNPELDKFIRYQAHYDRCYARASAELLRRKKERDLQQIRFESLKRQQAEETRREKREGRHEEKHLWAGAKAKLDIEHKQLRLNRAAEGRTSLQTA